MALVIGAVVVTTVDTHAEEPATATLYRRVHSAHAQMVRPFFDELDCENLGFVQPGEVEEHIGPIFLSFDANGSRDIDLSEWQRYPYMLHKSLMKLSFSVADRNGNKVVSFREFTEYLSLAVTTLDADHDGEVSPAELEALLPAD